MDSKGLMEKAALDAGCDAALCEKTLAALAATLRERCCALDTVAIPGFGSFIAEKNDEHVETDAATGRRRLIPPHISVRFNPGSKLRKLLSAHE